MKQFLISILVALTILGKSQSDVNYVIMLSLDGFRWDYPNEIPTPNLDKIAKMGVRSSLQASFPTKTFPNHYSIATGLYPGNHGIVNNTFFDPGRSVVYKISDLSKVQDEYFYGGEPIWVTARKQGILTASYHWVGTTAPIMGYLPDIYKVYKHHESGYQKVDSIISWLKLPLEMRPRLITWYLPEPDGVGHDFGPNSQQVKQKVMELDSLVGYFLSEISKLEINGRINIIVTSDHGMEEISHDRVILLSDYLKAEWYEHIYGSNPVFNIWAKDGFADSIAIGLSKAGHLKFYSPETIPARLHYMQNPRCGDFVVVADSSYSVEIERNRMNGIGGTHGYDNQNTNMNAIFYAYGPAFKQGEYFPAIQNVDIYNMICKILQLQPAKNDGDDDGMIFLK